jgi:hypothetical protein
MSNYNWACFECREAVRRGIATYSRRVACPKCGATTRFLGDKIPIPPKRDAKSWLALRSQLAKAQRDRAMKRFEANVRRRHDLEQEIVRLRSLPTNAGRQQAIKFLRKQLGV